jgi:dTDP-4-amino-4,6-dideoxygalactose transaminase
VPAAIRDAVRQDLADRKIGTEIYYPVPLHLQKCFAHLHYTKGIFPHAERAALEAIALPIYPDLTQAQLDHVAVSVVESVRNRMGVIAR